MLSKKAFLRASCNLLFFRSYEDSSSPVWPPWTFHNRTRRCLFCSVACSPHSMSQRKWYGTIIKSSFCVPSARVGNEGLCSTFLWGTLKRIIELFKSNLGASVTNHYLPFLYLLVFQINGTYYTLTSISLIWLRHFPVRIIKMREKIMLAREPSVQCKMLKQQAFFYIFSVLKDSVYNSKYLKSLTEHIYQITDLDFMRLVFLLPRMKFKIFLYSNPKTCTT